eukprot:scaffold1727_cov133-Cylindrotheca_fusiformis.AAC.30
MKDSFKLVALTILLQGCRVVSATSCPRIKDTWNATKANGDKLRMDTKDGEGRYGEISGVNFSPTQKGPSGDPAIFSFSDGGAGARIGMWDSKTGERLLTLLLNSDMTINWDWESMSIGSCGNTGRSDTCLYIADTGDNTARASGGRRTSRDGYLPRIMKIKEPKLGDFNDLDVIPDSHISVLTIDYRHSSSPTKYADMEAMFIDYTGWGEDGRIGDLYMITKWGGRRSQTLTRLFKIPPNVWPNEYNMKVSHYSPFAVGHYDWQGYEDNAGDTVVTDGQLLGNVWVGADMSLDGTLITLSTTKFSAMFLRCPGTSVADALAAPDARTRYCRVWDQPTGRSQVESFGFSPDGRFGLAIPEGNRPRMGWTEFAYTDKNDACSGQPPPPTSKPTKSPTPPPTPGPTKSPTPPPTPEPTKEPTPPPTPEPTKGPTLSPTEPLPTRSPTPMPTMIPSSAPSESFGFLAMFGNGVPGLGLCEADCDSDAECSDGLICYTRSKGESSVPGCSGNADRLGDGNEDFCIYPDMRMAGDGIDGLGLCEADCDSDADCAGDLVCYLRSNGSSVVPGCRGDPNEIGDGREDFCIMPPASVAALSLVGNGITGLDVCEADCDRDSDCVGTLVCYQRGKGTQDVPGCQGNADDFGDGNEDFCVHPMAIVTESRVEPTNWEWGERETIILLAASAFVIFFVLIGVTYCTFCKSKAGKQLDDSSIDMHTSVWSLDGPKSQSDGEPDVSTNREKVAGKPSKRIRV